MLNVVMVSLTRISYSPVRVVSLATVEAIARLQKEAGGVLIPLLLERLSLTSQGSQYQLLSPEHQGCIFEAALLRKHEAVELKEKMAAEKISAIIINDLPIRQVTALLEQLRLG